MPLCSSLSCICQACTCLLSVHCQETFHHVPDQVHIDRGWSGSSASNCKLSEASLCAFMGRECVRFGPLQRPASPWPRDFHHDHVFNINAMTLSSSKDQFAHKNDSLPVISSESGYIAQSQASRRRRCFTSDQSSHHRAGHERQAGNLQVRACQFLPCATCAYSSCRAS